MPNTWTLQKSENQKPSRLESGINISLTIINDISIIGHIMLKMELQFCEISIYTTQWFRKLYHLQATTLKKFDLYYSRDQNLFSNSMNWLYST